MNNPAIGFGIVIWETVNDENAANELMYLFNDDKLKWTFYMTEQAFGVCVLVRESIYTGNPPNTILFDNKVKPEWIEWIRNYCEKNGWYYERPQWMITEMPYERAVSV